MILCLTYFYKVFSYVNTDTSIDTNNNNTYCQLPVHPTLCSIYYIVYLCYSLAVADPLLYREEFVAQSGRLEVG
jgi:hypothetical protein